MTRYGQTTANTIMINIRMRPGFLKKLICITPKFFISISQANM